jgi:AraC-like DNA-binding protein
MAHMHRSGIAADLRGPPVREKLPFLPVYTEAFNAVPGYSGMPFGALANDNPFQIGLRSLRYLRPAHSYIESAPVTSPESRSHRLDESRLHRVLNYIAQYVDEPVTAAQLAGVAYFSLLHFTRIFDATTGEAPHVSQQPLKNAIVLRAAGKRSLSDRIIGANDAFLPMVRYDRENLALSCVLLADLTLLERLNQCETDWQK